MSSVEEQVIDFHYELFDRIFTQPFRPNIKERLRRDAVKRQVEEAAGAASQALTRFFISQQLSEQQVHETLEGFTALYDLIKLEDIANPNRTPEALVEDLLNKHTCPTVVSETGGPVYRVALHQTVQVLMLVGPVMMEWQRLGFSRTYEMPRRIVTQLNQITEGLKALASAGQEAADERYELDYRDHLLQRFYRVEAGTVRMTTNLNVDLRELFVMPRLTVRPDRKTVCIAGEIANALMDLSAARAILAKSEEAPSDEKDQSVLAIDQVRRSPRNVIVGTPGSGKSTLFEWLQLSLANVEDELVAGGGQAIPLLLRVRQLDPKNLPHGADLIEKATASRDRATLMPQGWIDRQMKAGRLLFMLDGLDETEPNIRDDYIIPWISDLCKNYPDCLYLISSRPVGYPPGMLQELKFAECELNDFTEQQIAEYTRHWCTAIRIAQNDPDEEARREGAREGDEIVSGFKGHPYIRNLARNPLMLSAICLVNYFEGGQLPKDRAVLYRLCVEGLLHHWDQRRGIRSEYSLDEKLRVCREVALAMQADDRAEYPAVQVLEIFAEVLKDKNRAKNLLEHIRYRTGLLIERRSGVFAFAHLTFQEYLAARAVCDSNYQNIDINQLARAHSDGRWDEVIALYCGLASAKLSREMLKALMRQNESDRLAAVLGETFLSSSSELIQDMKFRARVLKRIAIAPASPKSVLNRFPVEEAAQVANSQVGKIRSGSSLSEAYRFLLVRPSKVDGLQIARHLKKWRTMNPLQMGELMDLIHRYGEDEGLTLITKVPDIYKAPGPKFHSRLFYTSQAEVASLGLGSRLSKQGGRQSTGPGIEKAILQILRTICDQETFSERISQFLRAFHKKIPIPRDVSTWPELIFLTRKLRSRLLERPPGFYYKEAARFASALKVWADRLEKRMTARPFKQGQSTSKQVVTLSKRQASSKRTAKKPIKRSPKQ